MAVTKLTQATLESYLKLEETFKVKLYEKMLTKDLTVHMISQAIRLCQVCCVQQTKSVGIAVWFCHSSTKPVLIIIISISIIIVIIIIIIQGLLLSFNFSSSASWWLKCCLWSALLLATSNIQKQKKKENKEDAT